MVLALLVKAICHLELRDGNKIQKCRKERKVLKFFVAEHLKDMRDDLAIARIGKIQKLNTKQESPDHSKDYHTLEYK